MNKKYISLSAYESELNQALKKLTTIFPKGEKSRKIAQALKVSAAVLSEIINNIVQINKSLEVVRKMESLREKEIKGNHAAKKFHDKRYDLIDELTKTRDSLIEQFMSQMKVCKKQRDSYGYSIEDKKEKETFDSYAKPFDMMYYEANVNIKNIPFDAEPYFKEGKAEIKEHDETEKYIEQKTEREKDELDELYALLMHMTAVLSQHKDDSLHDNIEREVKAIRKVFPGRVIEMSKATFDKFQTSSKVKNDLEQIKAMFGKMGYLVGDDKRIVALRKHIKELETLLNQAYEEENKRNNELALEAGTIDKKVDLATDAVKEYRDILIENQQTKNDKENIFGNATPLQQENHQLASQANDIREEAKKEEDKQPALMSKYERDKIEGMYADAREKEEQIHENNKILAEKMAKEIEYSLPPEYVDMKKKLQNISALYSIGSGRSVAGGSQR